MSLLKEYKKKVISYERNLVESFSLEIKSSDVPKFFL